MPPCVLGDKIALWAASPSALPALPEPMAPHSVRNDASASYLSSYFRARKEHSVAQTCFLSSARPAAQPKSSRQESAMISANLLSQFHMLGQMLSATLSLRLSYAPCSIVQQRSTLTDMVKLGTRHRHQLNAVNEQRIPFARVVGLALPRRMAVMAVVLHGKASLRPKKVAHYPGKPRCRHSPGRKGNALVQARRRKPQTPSAHRGKGEDGELGFHNRS